MRYKLLYRLVCVMNRLACLLFTYSNRISKRAYILDQWLWDNAGSNDFRLAKPSPQKGGGE